MGNLNPNLLSKDSTALLNEAVTLMRSVNKKTLYPELILLALVRKPDTAAARLLHRFKETRGLDLDRLERTARIAAETRRDVDGDLTFTTYNNEKVSLSRQTIVMLDEALSVAQASNTVYIEPDHILAVMTESKMSTASVLRQFGITPQMMMDAIGGRPISPTPSATTPTSTSSVSSPLPTSGGSITDVVANVRRGVVRAVYFRDDLLNTLINMVSQRINRHVILLGPDGVGKRTLIYSLGLLMAQNKGPAGLTKLIVIDEAALLDNPVQAITAGLNQARGGILVLPHIERFFGGAAKAEFPKATPLLQKAILADDPVIIGTAPENEYEGRMAGTSGMERVQVLRIPEPNEAESLEILKVVSPHIASDYKLKVADDALKTAVTLAKRYMTNTPLPRSAEHLMHRAAAMVLVSQQAPGNDGKPADSILDGEDVTLACAQITGIPVAKLGQDERTKYAAMVEHLHERIIGQDEAVLAVSRAVKTARVGLKDPKRPTGSFLFLGPSGVGKTELAKALAEFMFGTEESLLEIDMSEYMDDGSVNKLIGAPPGYVGYEGGGQLTDKVRQQPYIVVLFDEVEKANKRVLDILLQVLEAGRLTDGQGRLATFSEAVIIMTSNLGAQHLQDIDITEDDREGVMDEVRSFFRPEFLNRLDDIVIFHPLSQDDLRKILELLLKKETKLADSRGLKLDFTTAAKEWMLAQNDHPEWGARPLRRIIGRSVREPLADYLLRENPPPGTTVRIDATQNAAALSFSMAQSVN
jgi:ATP-dependent Clp protease ATP-binding subunit ClpC